MTLKIFSWNIWIDGNFDSVVDFLKKSKADIIGLQEVQSDIPSRNIIKSLNDLGYEHVFAPLKKTRKGNVLSDGPAVFSNHKIIKSQIHTLSQESPRAAAQADIKIDSQILHVFSTHLIHTHQHSSSLQEDQAENLVKVLTKGKTILMGDFNALPDSKTIKTISKVLVNTDAENKPTWCLYPEGCKECKTDRVEFKLDYIFASQDLKTSNFKVEDSKGSDHLPISVKLDLQ